MRFPEMARDILMQYVPEARTEAAAWGRRPGIVWVRWQRHDGKYVSVALRRHLDWVTGEVGVSPEPVPHEGLPLEIGQDFTQPAFRVRLGVLMHEEDRWWPVGETTKEIRDRLTSLVLQLRAKVDQIGMKVGARR